MWAMKGVCKIWRSLYAEYHETDSVWLAMINLFDALSVTVKSGQYRVRHGFNDPVTVR